MTEQPTGYMEIIFLDSDGMGQRTDLELSGTNWDDTQVMFALYRRYEVSKEKSTFLIDLYDGQDNLVDTILLDDKGFTKVTGQNPKTEADYHAIDSEFWENVRAAKAS